MKKNIIILAIFTLMIFMFDLINTNLDFIIETNENNVRSQKIIIAEKSYQKINLMKTKIDSLNSFKTVFQKKTDLIAKLLRKYHLKKYSKFIKESDYPNILTLQIYPENLSAEKYSKFTKILSDSKSQIVFNRKIVEKSIKKIGKITKIKPIVKSLEFVFGVLILFSIQNMYEKNEDKYWEIFYNSGGQKNTRMTEFLIQYFVIVFISSIIALFLENYIAKIYHLQISKFNVPSQIGMPVLSGIFVYYKNIKRRN